MRSSSSSDKKSFSPINKDPIYRAHNIYSKIFDKNVTLRPGARSETNCRGFIFINFDQKAFSKVSYEEYELGGRKYYKLACGHTFKSGENTSHHVGKTMPCSECASEMAYWSLEHEWSHIIFRSNPFLYSSFVKKYQHKLIQEGYDLKVGQLGDFLYLMVNAFDDIRCNSLEEHVYPGAADKIWTKWLNICRANKELNEDFISFIFGVALGAENVNHQEGEFHELVPIIKEATDKIRLKGPANMLAVVRWALDRCVKKLLKDQPPEEDDDQQGGDQDSDDQQQDKDDQSAGSQKPSPGDQGQGVPRQDGQGSSGDSGDDSSQGQSKGASSDRGSGDSQATPGDSFRGDQQLTPGDALRLMAKGASPLTEDEGFIRPGLSDRDPASQATNAAAQQALSQDVDSDSFDDTIKVGQPDADVQDALNKLQSMNDQPGATEFILSQAKANMLLVDVKPRDIRAGSEIEINDQDKMAIDRMRAAFAKAMGRERYKMDTDGADVDVASVIQFLLDPSDNEMFDLETVQKGFAYRILGDMSGSMNGAPFTTVCRAHEMLKRALDYPFVQGDFWGFRGAEDHNARSNAGSRNWARAVTKGGQIWLYRYDPACKGYLGRSKGVGLKGNSAVVDVKCGGLTPMNSALHVALKDLVTQTPAGMAKRMFLLTDGNPTQYTTRGTGLSSKFLRGLVAKEIRTARQKGTQVYTFIIGRAISDEHALEMFGPPRFWRRVGGDVSIGQALVEVVLSEFVKYLKSK